VVVAPARIGDLADPCGAVVVAAKQGHRIVGAPGSGLVTSQPDGRTWRRTKTPSGPALRPFRLPSAEVIGRRGVT
jgi:hypothetical protein